jgi:hypothetical protein
VDKKPGILKIDKVEQKVLDEYMAHAFITFIVQSQLNMAL